MESKAERSLMHRFNLAKVLYTQPIDFVCIAAYVACLGSFSLAYSPLEDQKMEYC